MSFSAGSFAGGFADSFTRAFDAGTRARYYRMLMAQQTQKSPAALAFQHGMQGFLNRGGAGGSSGASGATGGSYSGKLNQDTVKMVFDQLTQRGVKPQVAAGAIAGLMGESGTGLDPKAFNEKDPHGGSGGIGQWNDTRLVGDNGVLAFAVKNGVDGIDINSPRDISKVPVDIQAKYLGHELDTTYSHVLKGLQVSNTSEEGLTNWVNNYEVPAEPAKDIAKRMQFIQPVVNFLSGQDGTTGTPTVIPVSAQPVTKVNAPTGTFGGPTAATSTGQPVQTDDQGRAIDPATGQPTQNASTGLNNAPLPPSRPPNLGIPDQPNISAPTDANQAANTQVLASGAIPANPGGDVRSPAPVSMPQPIAPPPPPEPIQQPVTIASNDQDMAIPMDIDAKGGRIRKYDNGGMVDTRPISEKLADSMQARTLPTNQMLVGAKGGLIPRYADGGVVPLPPDDEDNTPPPADQPQAITPDQEDLQNTDWQNQTQDAQSQVARDTGIPDNIEAAGYGGGSGGPYGYSALGRMQSQAKRSGVPHMGAPTSRGGGRGMGGGMPRISGSGQGGQGPEPLGFGLEDKPINDGTGGISTGVRNAIMGGFQYLGQMVGGNNAIPNNSAQGNVRGAVLNGAGAFSESDVKQIHKTVDPDGILNDNMANLAGLEEMHKYYLATGNINAANATAASMLQYTREVTMQYGSEAYNLLSKEGVTQRAVDMMAKADDHIPNGRTTTGKVLEDGNVDVTQRDMNGNIVNKLKATPDQVLDAALGLKQGTLYFSQLQEVLMPKSQQAQQSPQLERALSGLYGGQPGVGGGQSVTQAPAIPAPHSNAPHSNAPQITPAVATAPASDEATPTSAVMSPQDNAPAPTPAAAIPTPEQPVTTQSNQGQTPAVTQAAITPPAAPNTLAPLQPISQQYAALTDKYYSMLPKMPAQLQQGPPEYLTDRRDISAYLQHQKALQNEWVKNIYAPAKSEADKQVSLLMEDMRSQQQDTRQSKSAMDVANRTGALEQAREQSSQAAAALLEKNKEAAASTIEQNRQNFETRKENWADTKPWDITHPEVYKLMSGADDTKTPQDHFSSIMPAAFAKPDTDPATAASQFNDRFKDNKEAIPIMRDAGVNIALTNRWAPDTALKAVASIVTPKNTDYTSEPKATPIKGRDGYVGVTIGSRNIIVPKDDFMQLMNIRGQQIVQAKKQVANTDNTNAVQSKANALGEKVVTEKTGTSAEVGRQQQAQDFQNQTTQADTAIQTGIPMPLPGSPLIQPNRPPSIPMRQPGIWHQGGTSTGPVIPGPIIRQNYEPPPRTAYGIPIDQLPSR